MFLVQFRNCVVEKISVQNICREQSYLPCMVLIVLLIMVDVEHMRQYIVNLGSQHHASFTSVVPARSVPGQEQQ